MESTYPTRYADRSGVEHTTLRNHGSRLSLYLRGVSFSGGDLHSLEADPQAAPESLASFTRHWGSLCNCILEFVMPIPVVFVGRTVTCPLEVRLELGRPAPNNFLDRVLTLALEADGRRFCSKGDSGWFEDELLTLQASMPADAYLKACICCAHSDYSPYGHGLFGDMACFRNQKDVYARVKNKFDLFEILDEGQRVQETYLCSDFERRRPNTGYRG